MENKLFFIKQNGRKHIDAKGCYNVKNGSFTVLPGSIIPYLTSGTCKCVDLRESLIEKHCHLVENDDAIVDTPISFPTPSSAAVFCRNASSNGWTEWKDENKSTLSSFYREK